MENYGKIVVFAGGPSSEREISLKSGRAVYDALKRKGQNLELFDVNENLHEELKKINADIVFLALHGRFGEDGTVQAMLEELDIPYTGSGVEASRFALDKIISRKIFVKNNLNVPRHKVIKRQGDPKGILKEFKKPFVVKPQSEGSSIGLTVVKDNSQENDALNEAFRYGDKVLIEEYIHGRELTVGILEEEALPVIEIVAKNKVYDYGAKYEDKETSYVVPAGLKDTECKKAQSDAEKAHKALNCRDFSRVDMRMGEDGKIFVLEVNTIPGMTERSLLPKAASAAGIDFEDLCIKLVDLAYRRRKKNGQKQFK